VAMLKKTIVYALCNLTINGNLPSSCTPLTLFVCGKWYNALSVSKVINKKKFKVPLYYINFQWQILHRVASTSPSVQTYRYT